MAQNKKTNTYRKFAGKGGAKSRPDRKDQRVKDAAERLEAWVKLSVKEKLKEIGFRPGKSAKQIARINKVDKAA